MSAPPPNVSTPLPQGDNQGAGPQKRRSAWVHVVIPVVTFAVGLGAGLLIPSSGLGSHSAEAPEDPAFPSASSSTASEETSPLRKGTDKPSEDKGSPTPSPSQTSPDADPENPIHGDMFGLGDRVQFAGMDITYTAVEMTDSIDTVDGGTIAAESGEVLVLLSSDFKNPGPDTVDLSCSGVNDAYIQMFDWDDNEIAQVFDTYEIPGNPGCNDQLLVGQEAQWNTLWRTVEGSEPAYLSISDTNTWDEIGIALDDDVTLTIQ